MAGPPHSNFQERVEQAAEAVLKRDGSFGPLELFQEMRLLQPCHVEGWRKGNEHYQALQPWIQVGLAGDTALSRRRVLAEWSGA